MKKMITIVMVAAIFVTITNIQSLAVDKRNEESDTVLKQCGVNDKVISSLSEQEKQRLIEIYKTDSHSVTIESTVAKFDATIKV